MHKKVLKFKSKWFYDPISLLFGSANMALTTIYRRLYCCITFFFRCVYCTLFVCAYIIYDSFFVSSCQLLIIQINQNTNLFLSFCHQFTQLLNAKNLFCSKKLVSYISTQWWLNSGGVFLIHLW